MAGSDGEWEWEWVVVVAGREAVVGEGVGDVVARGVCVVREKI